MLYATVRQRKIHVKNPVTVIQNGIGVDWLILDMDDEWKKMTSIICVFTNGETAKEMLHEFGKPVQVPWECLAETGLLSVSCTGYMQDGDDLLTMTTMQPDSFWNVVQNGPVTGEPAMEPTPTLYEQVLAAAGAANSAARQATEVSAQLLEDKENGVFDGEDGISPTVKVGTVTTGESGGEAQVHQSGTGSDVILNFVIPRGLQGIRGPQGLTGAQGPEGKQGIQGEPGVGFTDQIKVESMSSPSGGGYTKYTYYLTDGSTREITVRHGKDGEKGDTGQTGKFYYPSVDESGNLSWTATPAPVHMAEPETVNIRGPEGKQGIQGEPGVGFTDRVGVQNSTSSSGGGYTKYTYYMTDGSTREITVHHGKDGEKGDTGQTGKFYYPSVDESGNLSWTATPAPVHMAEPETVNIMGAQGEPGKTPVKGTDYWTADDKTEIVNDVLEKMPAIGDAVLYSPQSLTDAQKEQARTNIGVEETVMDLLVKMSIAPVVLDKNGALLADGDGAILLNV